MFEFLEMFPLLKFIFNTIDLYIHYFSIVYNIVYIIIIYIIILLLLLIFKNNDVIYYGSNIISKILSFNYIYDSDNIKLIDKYVNSDENVITIMNHRSLFDIIIGLSMFRKLSCIYNKDGPSKIPLFDIINKQLNNVCVGKESTTNKIIEYTKNRKKGENILILAPDQCRYPDDINISGIASFKTGAFVGLFPIAPIIVKYDDIRLDYIWENGESIFHAFFKVFLSKNYNIKVKVLEKIYPDTNSTIEQFRDKVYKIMSEEYKNL